jgi:alpha-D-ribose 1-methylphosphonate 5-phosphate C-P lyase
MTAPTETGHYNFAYLDEATKRMIRRAILKGISVPGYQVPFPAAKCPCPTAGAPAACRSPPPA